MVRFSEMLGQFQLNMSNRSFPAEPEVPGLTPLSGQSPPLQCPVCTDAFVTFHVPFSRLLRSCCRLGILQKTT